MKRKLVCDLDKNVLYCAMILLSLSLSVQCSLTSFEYLNSYIYIRAVHGSIWVGFVPNLEPTCAKSGGKKMHPPPTTRVIRLGESDHQRAAGGLVGVENPENGKNWRENGENPAKKF